MELNELGRPVAFLAKMVGHRPLAFQLVSQGLLDPNRMRRLFDSSVPKEVTLDTLMIVSDLARMDKVRFLLTQCFLITKANIMLVCPFCQFNGGYTQVERSRHMEHSML